MPERIKDLAKEWTAGANTSLERAQAIESHLRKDYRYDLASPSGRDKQPLDHFLFESKRGHCEFYSTAMAVMLRVVDVPTRNVTGFIGGTWNRFGRFYAVRNGDAHSWVEVYLDGQGWMTFDPTPPADSAPKSEITGAWAYLRDFIEATSQRWDRHVVGYDLNQQVSLLSAISSRYKRAESMVPSRYRRPYTAIGAALLGAGFLGGVIYWRRRRRKGSEAGRGPGEAKSPNARVATALYEMLDGAMSSQGLGRAPGTPPLKHAEALMSLDHPLAEEIRALTERYLGARFGGVALSEEERRDFEQRVKHLRSADVRARLPPGTLEKATPSN
jgi:hypothetical protein